MRTLTKGMEVEIFEDPITCKRLEGKANLIKKLIAKRSIPNGLEYWKVKFPSDGAVVDRFIKP